MTRQTYSIQISRETELEPEPWSAIAFDSQDRTVAATAGASVHDLLIDLAKDIDKVSGEQAKADRVRDQLSKVFGR